MEVDKKFEAQLKVLSDSIEELTSLVHAIVDKQGGEIPLEDIGPLGKYSHSYLAEAAKVIYNNRRNREKILPDKLFAEPAWDMLLELFICEYLGKELSTNSLCFSSNSPQTTALRWINVLEEEGLVVRRRTEFDSRLNLVELTGEGRKCVRRVLTEWVDNLSNCWNQMNRRPIFFHKSINLQPSVPDNNRIMCKSNY